MGNSIIEDVFGVKKRKKAINSKDKGNRNENVAAKYLQTWTGKEFTRVPSSGGLRWMNSQNVTGDVMCTDLFYNFPFAVETKHHIHFAMDGVSLDTIQLRKNSKVVTVYNKAREDADRANKYPLLMLRKNNMPKGTFCIFTDERIIKLIGIKGSHIRAYSEKYDINLYGWRSEVFIKRVNCDEIIFQIKKVMAMNPDDFRVKDIKVWQT